MPPRSSWKTSDKAARALAAARSTVPAVVVPDSRRAMAPIASHFFGNPADELTLVGITGTNGKTSTSYLVESILARANRATGLIGTVAIRYASETLRAVNTTPESLDLQRVLRAMRTHAVDAVVMEVSSHGLELGRVSGCRFQVAAITNVTQDHLDFHGSMDAYHASKLRLFREHLAPDGAAVINVDDPSAPRSLEAARESGARVIRATRRPDVEAEVKLLAAEVSLDGTRARLRLPAGELDVELPLLGDFNLENLVVAAGIAAALEVPLDAIALGVAHCPQVPGRMELVAPAPGEAPTVIVDYAHTPDAVEKLLKAVRPLARGRLITVFGCGGDRDRAKRPLMARAVVDTSDRIVATSDNPRTEDPLQILRDVEAGLSDLKRVEAEALRHERSRLCGGGRPAGRDRARRLDRPPRGHRRARRQGTRGLPDRGAQEAALRRSRRGRARPGRVAHAPCRGRRMSVPFDARDVVGWTGGRLLAGQADTRFRGVGIDSRQVGPGDLFVAIVGPNHDAHRFVPQVAEAGVAGVLVAQGRLPERPDTLCVIEVPDTTAALGALGAGHRGGFRGPVVAITGSSGKTTTKEMCAAILSAAGPCLKTEGNLNNEFGVPLTLLRRESHHERLVIEMGMNHQGEIAKLAALARPTVALVTNCGVAHIEFLGSREAIAREKGDLYAALAPEGVAIANLDDERAAAQARRFGGRLIGYSCGDAGDVRARRARFVEGGAFAFTLETPEGKAEVRVTGLGATTVTNATGAAAAAMAAGATLDHVVQGLAAYRPPKGRMAPSPIAPGATVIDDSYNANPASMRASLEALASLAGERGGIAVLGRHGRARRHGCRRPPRRRTLGGGARPARPRRPGRPRRPHGRGSPRRRHGREPDPRGLEPRGGEPLGAAAAARRRLGAGQGIPRDEARTRRAGAPRGERIDALPPALSARGAVQRLQRGPLHHVPHGGGHADGALHHVPRRPVADPPPRRPARGAADPRDRTRPPVEGRNADHGRAAHPARAAWSRCCCGPSSTTASSGSCSD